MKISLQPGKKYGFISFIFLINLIIHDTKSLPCWQLNTHALIASQTRTELVIKHDFTNLQEFIFNKYFPDSSTFNIHNYQCTALNSSFFEYALKLTIVDNLKTSKMISTTSRIGLIHKCFTLHQSSNEDPHLFC